VIDKRHAKRLRCRIDETCASGRIFEPAVAEIPVKRRALTLVRLGRAVGLLLAVERAEPIRLNCPLDVVGDEEVETPAVLVTSVNLRLPVLRNNRFWPTAVM
jgi:hypothetical protein